MRVLAFGTYEQAYPRNRTAIEGLRLAGVQVIECHEPLWELETHKSGGALSAPALLRWAWRYARAALRLARRARAEQFDCVLVGYPAHLDVLLARLVARKRPIVFNPLLSLYDTLVLDRQRFAVGSLPARAIALLDRLAFGLSDRIVIDTDAHARWLVEQFGIRGAKLDVVRIGAEEIFAPLNGVQPPTGEFVVLFYGKLIPLHGIETILNAAELLERAPDEGDPIRIKFAGGGQLGEWLDAELKRRKLANLERIDWIDYEMLPQALAEAHVALGIFGTSDKAQRVVPNKAFQALACGTALITGDTVAARELFTDGHDALLVAPGDGGALAAAILKLRGDQVLRQGVGAAGRELFERTCSMNRVGKEFAVACERTKVESVG